MIDRLKFPRLHQLLQRAVPIVWSGGPFCLPRTYRNLRQAAHRNPSKTEKRYV